MTGIVYVRCWMTGGTIAIHPSGRRELGWAVRTILAGQREDPYADEIADAAAGHP